MSWGTPPHLTAIAEGPFNMPRTNRAIGVTLFVAAAALGCSSEPAPAAETIACGTSGTNFGADVVDSSGTAVSGLAITDSVPLTGVTFPIPNAEERPGHYVIMNTRLGFDSVGGGSAIPLLVRGTGASAKFSAVFVFGPISRCSYGKLAGPDTIVAK